MFDASGLRRCAARHPLIAGAFLGVFRGVLVQLRFGNGRRSRWLRSRSECRSQPWTLMQPLQIPLLLELLHSKRFGLPIQEASASSSPGGRTLYGKAAASVSASSSPAPAAVAPAALRTACSAAATEELPGNACSIRDMEQLVGWCSWPLWHFCFILAGVLVGRGHDFFAQAFSSKFRASHSIPPLLSASFLSPN